VKILLLFFLAASVIAWSAMPVHGDELSAQWIWKKRQSYLEYNDAIIARKTFQLPRVQRARILITADTRYRLFINDEWVNDGPCRSWPSHYHYDVIDISSRLRPGENTIRVVARFFGVGTFQQVPQQAGLLVQLEAEPQEGEVVTVVSDGSWEVADATELVQNTLKRCVQFGPYEIHDARHEDSHTFEPATVLFAAHSGPWRDLNSRDCTLLTHEPIVLKRFLGASIVRADWLAFGFPTCRLLYPGQFDANRHVSSKSAVATVIDGEREMTLHAENFHQGHYRFFVNGVEADDGACKLRRGENFFTAVIGNPFVAWHKDTIIRFVEIDGFTLRNPLDNSTEHPWCFVPLEEAKYVTSDYGWELLPDEEKKTIQRRIASVGDTYIRDTGDVDSFRENYGDVAIILAQELIMDDPHFQFQQRRVLKTASELVENPSGLMYDNQDSTVVTPNAEGAIELIYDLGAQHVGYFQFNLQGEDGLVVDVASVEYVSPTGEIQHTRAYRNSMRYICKEGWNRFTSNDRRSGRYVFITLRNQTKPAIIRNFRVVESTYPVEYQGRFSCSDETLNRIWEISAHGLKLCMEDTFTDCPLYEQTHWIGDARNEALFAYTVFGAYDLARRCITLTGQSLEHYPIVLSQTPSGWERIIPSFSFLWVLSIWDYYYETGDKDFLAKTYPWIIENLRGAAESKVERGLYSGPKRNNFLDWTNIDQHQPTVLHNSMLLVAALKVAERCGTVLGTKEDGDWLATYRTQLIEAINTLWDPKKGAYPDSIRADGTISESTSVHTSILSFLYDIVTDENREQAVENIISPPKGMVRVGSPFITFYRMKCLEKAGHQDDIIQLINQEYQPMLDAGATTVWESFATGTTGQDGFPTRSRCHGWAAAPIYYLNRLVLGIVPTAVGGQSFSISPRVSGVRWARGATASINGPIEVSWQLDDDMLHIRAKAPEGVDLRFIRNDTHDGLRVLFNGAVPE